MDIGEEDEREFVLIPAPEVEEPAPEVEPEVVPEPEPEPAR